MQYYGCGCVCVHVPGPYKQRLVNGSSLIRLQKWVCSHSPLSPVCLPLLLSLSNSFCLSHSLLTLCLCLSLPFWLQRAEACVIQASSSGTTTDHLSLACLYSSASLSLSFHLSTGWSTLPAGGWKPCDSLP